MTFNELPARAANILRAIGKSSTCTLETVESLRILLLSSHHGAVPSVSKGEAVSSRSRRGPSAAKSSAPRKASKEPQINIHEATGEAQAILRLDEKLILATEVANVTLKSLTSAAGAPKAAQTLGQKERPIARSSSSNPSPSTTTSSRCQTPLQVISANRTIPSPLRQSKEKRASSYCDPDTSGIRAQSECCRVAFACLRVLQASKSLSGRFTELQLEKGMSALIARLLAIGFEDLASKELRILKRRLENCIDASTRVREAAMVDMDETTRHLPAQEDSKFQKTSMASLLEYNVKGLAGPLLDLVVVSQLQALKLINGKVHGPTLEAALQHLQLDRDHALANLIVRQIDPKNLKKKTEALRQLESLTQLLFKLCPNTAQTKEKMLVLPSDVAPELAFQYQLLAFRIRFVWWNLSEHQPDIDKELLSPFAQCLTSFCRQCKLSVGVKYKLAKDAYNHIMEKSQPWTQLKKGDTTTILQSLSDLALRIGNSEEAMDWTRSALSNFIGTRGSPLQRLTLLCQHATMTLKVADAGIGESSLLDLLRNTVICLEGDLRGESAELDQTLVVVMGLRKATCLKLQKDCKLFEPVQLLSSTSILGQCAHIILLSGRFLARYLGQRPDQTASERKGLRYEQRKAMAAHVAASTVESVVFLAQLMAKSGIDLWLVVDSFLQDCISIAAIFGGDFPGTQEPEVPHIQDSIHPHVSLSQAYWYRYLCVRSLKGQADDHIGLLQSSTIILMHRPLHEKVAGALQMKLERLASTCINAHNYQRGLTAYRDIICIGVQHEILRRTVNSGSHISPFTTLRTDPDADIFLRALVAYPKTAIRLKLGGQQVKSFFDQESMPITERGLLLEQQFVSMESTLTSSSISAMHRVDINTLASLILALYTTERHPIRRQNFISRLCYLSLLHPGLWERSILDVLPTSAEKSSLLASGTNDEKFQCYADHSASYQRLYAVLIDMSRGEQIVQDTIAEWGSLVGTCPDLKLLEASVYDIEGWLLQLELIADYLAMQGYESWRTSVIDILVKVYECVHPTQYAKVVLKFIDLGMLYSRLGYSSHAGVILLKVQKYVDSCDLSALTIIRWHLAKAEYALTSGEYSESQDAVFRARDTSLQKTTKSTSAEAKLKDRIATAQTLADTFLLQSRVAAGSGRHDEAIYFGRICVQEYHRLWSTMERCNESNISERPTSSLVESMSEMSISKPLITKDTISKHACLQGVAFWTLVPRLFRSLLHLSDCFANSGILSEAKFYLTQCEKVAQAVRSPLMIATCLAAQGHYTICSGQTESGVASMQKAEQMARLLPLDYDRVALCSRLTELYIKDGYTENGIALGVATVHDIRGLINTNTRSNFTNSHVGHDLNSEASQNAEHGVKYSGDVSLQKKRSRVPVKKSNRSSRPLSKAKSAPKASTLPMPDAIPFSRLLARTCRYLADANLRQGALSDASVYINDASILPHQQQDVIDQGVLNAKLDLHQGLRHLAADPVYSIVPESTIAYPAIIGPRYPQTAGELDVKPPKGTRGSSRAAARKSPAREYVATEPLSVLLVSAKKHMDDALKCASSVSSTSICHTYTDMMGKILVMLSAVPVANRLSSPAKYMAYILELGRSLSGIRDLGAIDVERQLSLRREVQSWPSYEQRDNISVTSTTDLGSLQAECIDLIPKSWTVISMTLSESHDEIWVTKRRAGQNPFILRLPFSRENAMESNDDSSFGFDQGKNEMLDIITSANTSAHSAGDLSQKGAKTAWWNTRAALDTRLQDLLTNIEKIWLGGFRGILSQSGADVALLARFQQSFQAILERHLPSRRGPNKGTQAYRVTLDPHVLELFCGLGLPNDSNDIDEQMMDLLYFVIDILQFNGERNAYDEVDFDAIVIESLDALRQYHQAAANGNTTDDTPHTILILDKRLHCFPWESLPCLKGKSVSRLPSMECLRSRLFRMHNQKGESVQSPCRPDGLIINATRGAYVLNPGNDLTNTQAAFEEPLKKLSKWESIVQRGPSEEEVRACLEQSELFLYFGHGSGSQYIRSRTIKKLDECAVALLMGCSSGTLTETGEYEPYGTPMSYMHAGSPALLATLWDVTDKDIDRFSGEVLHKWGVFQEVPIIATKETAKKSTKQRGKTKVKDEGPAEEGSKSRMSLDEAVAKSRDTCILKYLNGAAPVVYGIPVFVA